MRDKLWVMTEQQNQNLFRKVNPLSTIQNNKFITRREKLETVIAKVSLFTRNSLDLTWKMSQIYVVYASRSDSCSILSFKNEQSHT